MKKVKKDTFQGVDAMTTVVSSAKIKSTKIGNREFKDMNAVFSDVSKFNTKEGEVRIDGLLGYEFMSKQKMKICFSSKQIILF